MFVVELLLRSSHISPSFAQVDERLDIRKKRSSPCVIDRPLGCARRYCRLPAGQMIIEHKRVHFIRLIGGRHRSHSLGRPHRGARQGLDHFPFRRCQNCVACNGSAQKSGGSAPTIRGRLLRHFCLCNKGRVSYHRVRFSPRDYSP